MDNGQVASQNPKGGWFLPEGRTWQPSTTPHFQRESILRVIRATHHRRALANWPRGDYRLRSRLTSRPEDESGVDDLVTRHAATRDQEFDA